MFGTGTLRRKFEPFHLYSMRQAIEEGFILDVLANYTTYQTYWKIEKAVTDDPAYEAPKARRAIAQFVSLHPPTWPRRPRSSSSTSGAHRRQDRWQGQGDGGDLLRLHAVRYKQALDAYITKRGTRTLPALVAFSGNVIDKGRPPPNPR